MKHVKVSLYTREPITRRYKLVPQRNKPDYPSTTTSVLRYGSTWETLRVNSLAAATDQKIQRELALLRGWVPTSKPNPESKSKVLMLDQATDQYLVEIKTGRKPKTYAAYDVALRYFFESTKNKPPKQIVRTDLIDFVSFLRVDKGQSPRSAYNKFKSVMTFLKHYDITGESLKIKPPLRFRDFSSHQGRLG